MIFAVGIFIYLISFLILTWASCRYGMDLFSAVTVGALLSSIILVLVIPPSEINHQVNMYMKDEPHKEADDVIVVIYLIIICLTIILITFYVLFTAFIERQIRLDKCPSDYNLEWYSLFK